jgi:hypothetical protein
MRTNNPELKPFVEKCNERLRHQLMTDDELRDELMGFDKKVEK